MCFENEKIIPSRYKGNKKKLRRELHKKMLVQIPIKNR